MNYNVFANSGDPDQTPRSAASDLGLHYLPITPLRVSRLQRVKTSVTEYRYDVYTLVLSCGEKKQQKKKKKEKKKKKKENRLVF